MPTPATPSNEPPADEPPANEAPANEAPANEATHECPACGALHAAAVRFCEECGAPFARRKGKRAGAALDREERKVVNVVLQKARKRLKLVRAILWIDAVTNLLAGALWLTAGARLLGAVGLGMGAVALAGALTLAHYPFGWTIGLAAMHTVFLVWSFAGGVYPLFWVLCVILLWLSVPVVARASRLIDEHEDLDATHLGARRLSSAPRSDARARAEKKRSADRRARLRFHAAFVGGALAVVVVGVFGYRALTAPKAREPRLAAFRVALEQGDTAGAAALCTPDYRAERWDKAVAVLAREGWATGDVELGQPELLRETARLAEVRYELPRGHVRTKWILHGREWCVDGVIFAEVRER